MVTAATCARERNDGAGEKIEFGVAPLYLAVYYSDQDAYKRPETNQKLMKPMVDTKRLSGLYSAKLNLHYLR